MILDIDDLNPLNNMPKPIKVRATVRMEITKTFDVWVENYTADPGITAPEDELERAIKAQFYMPYEAYRFIGDKKAGNDLKGWREEFFEAEQE